MPSSFLVYGLVDPITGEVRYVGKSSRGMKRPKIHLEPREIARDRNKHKARWIRSLLERGERPTIRILSQLDSDEEALRYEIEWIAWGRARGWPLTNLTDGGDGTAGLRLSKETRAKLSKVRVGMKRSAETRARIGALKIGKPRSEEAKAAMRAGWARRNAAIAAGETAAPIGRPRPDVAERNRGNKYGARKRSEEERVAIADGMRASHARRKIAHEQ